MRGGLTTAERIAITLATALMLGAATYVEAYSWEMPDLLTSWPVRVAPFVLAIAAVFVVYRWWALLPAIVPVLLNFYIHERPDYHPPWNEEGVSTEAAIFLLAVAIVLFAAVFAIGLLLRWVYESVRSRWGPRQGAVPPGSPG